MAECVFSLSGGLFGLLKTLSLFPPGRLQDGQSQEPISEIRGVKFVDDELAKFAVNY